VFFHDRLYGTNGCLPWSSVAAGRFGAAQGLHGLRLPPSDAAPLRPWQRRVLTGLKAAKAEGVWHNPPRLARVLALPAPALPAERLHGIARPVF
jgi:hypothetical protein